MSSKNFVRPLRCGTQEQSEVNFDFFFKFLLIAISLLKTNTQHPANMNIIETYLNMYTEACTLKQVAYKLKKNVYMLKIIFSWKISTEKSTHL